MAEKARKLRQHELVRLVVWLQDEVNVARIRHQGFSTGAEVAGRALGLVVSESTLTGAADSLGIGDEIRVPAIAAARRRAEPADDGAAALELCEELEQKVASFRDDFERLQRRAVSMTDINRATNPLSDAVLELRRRMGECEEWLQHFGERTKEDAAVPPGAAVADRVGHIESDLREFARQVGEIRHRLHMPRSEWIETMAGGRY